MASSGLTRMHRERGAQLEKGRLIHHVRSRIEQQLKFEGSSSRRAGTEQQHAACSVQWQRMASANSATTPVMRCSNAGATHLCADHGHGLALRGVDLAGHDGGAGLVLGQLRSRRQQGGA